MLCHLKLLVLSCFLFLVYASFSLNARELSKAELMILRDTICEYETRHLNGKNKDYAVSPKGALGRCQIMPTTAIETKNCNWWRLAEPEHNRACALAVLTDCGGNVYELSYCYNPARWYARTIASHYAKRIRHFQWQSKRLTLLAMEGL